METGMITTNDSDELLVLRAALNEKDLELLELREQHVALVARSQEARSNWESALSSKDRAIAQLEEALTSRQRAIDQLTTLASRSATLDAELQQREVKIAALERAALEAQSTIVALRQAASQHSQQLEALCNQQRAQDDRHLEHTRTQLTEAFQRELSIQKRQCEQLERAAEDRLEEGIQLRAALAERDEQVQFLTVKHQELKHQLEDLKEQVIQDKEFGWANEAQPAPPPQPPTSRDVCDLAVAAAALSQPLIDQVADLKQQLFQCQTKLQEREAKARKYKDAVRALQARLANAELNLSERNAQQQALRAEISQLKDLVQSQQASIQSQRQPFSFDQQHEQQQQQQKEQRLNHSRDGSHPPGGSGVPSGPESLMLAMLQELRQQSQDKDVMIGKLISEAETAAQERIQLIVSAEEANKRLDEARRYHNQCEEKYQEALAQMRIVEEQSRSTRQDEQAGHSRHSDDSERWTRQLEAQSDALRQADQAKLRYQEAQQTSDDLKRQVATLEARVEDLDRKLQEARRQIERSDQRAERAERGLRDSETQILEADRRCKQTESHSLGLERRIREYEARTADLERGAKEGEIRAADAEGRGKLAEARALDMEKRALDSESRCVHAERRLRDLDVQLQEAMARCRDAERLRQEQEVLARNAMAAEKQARQERERDLLQAHRTLDTRLQAEQRELADVKGQLERLRGAKGTAEARVAELEASLKQQEMSMASLRSGTQEVPLIKMSYEDRIRGLEEALNARERSIAQLTNRLGQIEAEYHKSVQSLLAEVSAKASALQEAEDRFSQLEGLMQRIAARGPAIVGM